MEQLSTNPPGKRRRRKGGAVLLGLFAVGLVGASAALLGPLNTGSLGADDKAITACDTDGIDTAYGVTYNAATQKFDNTSVKFSNVDAACAAQAYSVVLRDAAGASIGTATGTVTLTAGAFTVTVPAGTPAANVHGVSLAIYTP